MLFLYLQMNYTATIQYLYSRLPVFQRDGHSAYKPGLGNTLRMDNRLGNPHRNYQCIHVAGTNGKGSVSHLLAAVLQKAGYKVGLYTSPHLKDFRERIRINGRCISKKYVCEFVKKNQILFNEINPSFFEATMCMAFNFFADKKVDIAVIEVGLGGRLDSTNIITPLLSIITNISFDHQQYLGNTLTEIATEKAGIIKPNIPVIIGEAEGEIKTVFEKKTKKENAPIIFAQNDTNVVLISAKNEKQCFDCTNFPQLTVGLGGAYQQKNVATALTALQELQKQGLSISKKAIYKGFDGVTEITGLQGRWQILQQNPTIICDTGHNEGGIRYIVQQLQSMSYKRLHMVIGMVNDKDISTILSLLPQNAEYYFCKAIIPRALPENILAEKAKTNQLKGNTYPSVVSALNAAKENADKDDVIFVGGSTFVVAEVI